MSELAVRSCPQKSLAAASVLLVEDNEGMRVLIESMLERFGVRDITPASDGGEALSILRDREVDLIVTDHKMEPVSGVAFIDALRHVERGPAALTQVVMVTGHSDQTLVMEARRLGIGQFLAKPVRPDQLRRRLEWVLRNPVVFRRDGTRWVPRRAGPSASAEPGDNGAGGMWEIEDSA